MIATSPASAEATVRDGAAAGVGMVWMHRSFGEGSVCEEASTVARSNGMTVIEGGCPLMFAPTSDPLHKVMKFFLTRPGNVPTYV